ncbi:hypothetical protein FNV43_RR07258 [Rhamnella rubrinervis]|uniref:Uncharacterized protein n=1 Tax=Rhamnella rubrinervis TaxID=2594499 RepID=A0A8K0HEY3_9ROSA|nr:hypothetical protein FNV43_RR07258 [Rhamnella rubrinervis]
MRGFECGTYMMRHQGGQGIEEVHQCHGGNKSGKNDLAQANHLEDKSSGVGEEVSASKSDREGQGARSLGLDQVWGEEDGREVARWPEPKIYISEGAIGAIQETNDMIVVGPTPGFPPFGPRRVEAISPDAECVHDGRASSVGPSFLRSSRVLGTLLIRSRLELRGEPWHYNCQPLLVYRHRMSLLLNSSGDPMTFALVHHSCLDRVAKSWSGDFHLGSRPPFHKSKRMGSPRLPYLGWLACAVLTVIHRHLPLASSNRFLRLVTIVLFVDSAVRWLVDALARRISW